jgi:hypothetical protein
MNTEEEIATLKEAHATQRTALAMIQARVKRLEQALGPDRHTIGVSQTLREQVDQLRAQMWHDEAATKAIEQMQKLADSIHEIFHEDADDN